ncbi:hypothetical protein LCGC14_3100890, partial [marine sediment metagenome]
MSTSQNQNGSTTPKKRVGGKSCPKCKMPIKWIHGSVKPSPIRCWCRSWTLEEVKELVEQGAYLLKVDWQGDTALHVAARRGSCEIVDYLLD